MSWQMKFEIRYIYSRIRTGQSEQTVQNHFNNRLHCLPFRHNIPAGIWRLYNAASTSMQLHRRRGDIV